MGYRELLYNNNCKIYGKDVVVDELTGDFTKNVIYEGKCDYQPTRTKITDGTLTQTTPMLYLPYDAKKDTFVIGCDIEIITTNTTPNIKAKIRGYQEVNIKDKLVGIAIELAEVTY